MDSQLKMPTIYLFSFLKSSVSSSLPEFITSDVKLSDFILISDFSPLHI